MESRHVNARTCVCITHLGASARGHIWAQVHVCVCHWRKKRGRRKKKACAVFRGSFMEMSLRWFGGFALFCFVFAFQSVVRLEVTDPSVVSAVFWGAGISRVRVRPTLPTEGWGSVATVWSLLLWKAFLGARSVTLVQKSVVTSWSWAL